MAFHGTAGPPSAQKKRDEANCPRVAGAERTSTGSRMPVMHGVDAAAGDNRAHADLAMNSMTRRHAGGATG
jgi:hypothetical protein